MLIIISQVVLLLIAFTLPLKSKRDRIKEMKSLEIRRSYRIDTDTSKANYAINEFGSLEKINRLNWYHKSLR